MVRTRWPQRLRWADRLRSWTVGLVFVSLSLGTASDLFAHLALSNSSPASDGHLLVAPDVINLSFTEPVELGLSSVLVTGPDGQPVALGDLATVEASDVILAPIAGPLVAGTYKVTWQAVGRDGHPVRGEFSFVIEEGAAGLAVPVEAVTPPALEGLTAAPPAELPTFDSQSPLYAGVRWLGYLGILGSLGALGFALLLSSPRLRSESITPEFRDEAARGAAGLGILSVLLLGISLPLRLQAQSYALFGGGINADRFSLVVDSIWGVAWLLQLGGGILVLIGLLLARRGATPGWYIAAAGGLALTVTPGMSGHAASVEGWRGLAMAADAVHLLGVGLWLGTLVVMVGIAVPIARREAADRSGSVLARLLFAFSPLALLAAGIVLATGVLASTLHLSSLADLWQTPYGRVLTGKVLLVGVVLAVGAFNWQKVRPRAAEPGADRRLLKSAGAELVTAAVVVGLSAILVAEPAPAHSSEVANAPFVVEATSGDVTLGVVTEP